MGQRLRGRDLADARIDDEVDAERSRQRLGGLAATAQGRGHDTVRPLGQGQDLRGDRPRLGLADRVEAGILLAVAPGRGGLSVADDVNEAHGSIQDEKVAVAVRKRIGHAGPPHVFATLGIVKHFRIGGRAGRETRDSIEIGKNRPFAAGIQHRLFRRNFQQMQRNWRNGGFALIRELAGADQNRCIIAHIRPYSNDRWPRS